MFSFDDFFKLTFVLQDLEHWVQCCPAKDHRSDELVGQWGLRNQTRRWPTSRSKMPLSCKRSFLKFISVLRARSPMNDVTHFCAFDSRFKYVWIFSHFSTPELMVTQPPELTQLQFTDTSMISPSSSEHRTTTPALLMYVPLFLTAIF